jgi:hypothetical protein
MRERPQMRRWWRRGSRHGSRHRCGREWRRAPSSLSAGFRLDLRLEACLVRGVQGASCNKRRTWSTMRRRRHRRGRWSGCGCGSTLCSTRAQVSLIVGRRVRRDATLMESLGGRCPRWPVEPLEEFALLWSAACGLAPPETLPTRWPRLVDLELHDRILAMIRAARSIRVSTQLFGPAGAARRLLSRHLLLRRPRSESGVQQVQSACCLTS